MVSVEDVTEALRDVIDPELGLDFVELGLIYDVEVDGGTVNVTFTLTSPGCPIGPQVTEQIEEFVGELGDVEQVTTTMVFSIPRARPVVSARRSAAQGGDGDPGRDFGRKGWGSGDAEAPHPSTRTLNRAGSWSDASATAIR
jgi:metal-sulfur cluster biosynthetic enzyme